MGSLLGVTCEQRSTHRTRSGHLWRWVDRDCTRIHH